MRYIHHDDGTVSLPSISTGRHSSRSRTRKWLANRSLVAKFSLLAVNVVVVGIVSGVILGNRASSYLPKSALAQSTSVASPLDTVSSSDIAANIAKVTKLPETTAIINQAQSADVQAASSSAAGSDIIQKPNIISTVFKSKADIISYSAQASDTVASLATKFGVTSDSIRWSNDITSNAITPGKQLYISPISNGIVYTVKDGDTPESLAQKFHANRDKIVAFNDAELKGLTVGDRIVIPDGSVIPLAAVSSFQTIGNGFAWGGSTPVYGAGANGYDFGQCTYWAALRRSQIGKPVPSNLGNAVTWVTLAQKAGLSTGNIPQKGAVIWTPPSMLSSYYAQYGHVGFVEDVLPDGTVKISDMNVKGWDVLSPRTLTPAQAGDYTYIY